MQIRILEKNKEDEWVLIYCSTKSRMTKRCRELVAMIDAADYMAMDYVGVCFPYDPELRIYYFCKIGRYNHVRERRRERESLCAGW